MAHTVKSGLPYMATFKINLNRQDIEFEVTRQGDVLHVWQNGEPLEVRLVAQDETTLLLEQTLPDGRRQRVRVAAHLAGDRRQIWVNGRTFAYERVRERGSGSSGDGSLAASIPAVVSQVLVSVGDAVAAGDKLILLESMKMVIPIQAPYAGVVTAVNCTAGEPVQAGVPLIDLQPSDS